MTLYEIDKAIEEAILEAIDTETGEIIGDLSILDGLEIAREKKIENIGLYIKNLNCEAESIEEEERALYDRRKTKKNKAERLKRYLSDALKGSKFETPRLVVSFRKSTSVQVEDVDKLPEEYRTVTIAPDKTAIKTALRAGVEIAGAQLIENQNLQIK